MGGGFQGGGPCSAHPPVGLSQPSKLNGDVGDAAQPQHQHRGENRTRGPAEVTVIISDAPRDQRPALKGGC